MQYFIFIFLLFFFVKSRIIFKLMWINIQSCISFFSKPIKNIVWNFYRKKTFLQVFFLWTNRVPTVKLLFAYTLTTRKHVCRMSRVINHNSLKEGFINQLGTYTFSNAVHTCFKLKLLHLISAKAHSFFNIIKFHFIYPTLALFWSWVRNISINVMSDVVFKWICYLVDLINNEKLRTHIILNIGLHLTSRV